MRHLQWQLRYVLVLLLSACLLMSGCSTEGSVQGTQAATGAQEQSLGSSQEGEGSEQAPVKALQEKHFSLVELQEDFDEIKTTMDYFHPKLYTDIEALEALMATQYAKL